MHHCRRVERRSRLTRLTGAFADILYLSVAVTTTCTLREVESCVMGFHDSNYRFVTLD